MKILSVSGYNAWDKVSRGRMYSHHLYGIHECVEKYIPHNGSIRGILKPEILGEGYVDFYHWKPGKKNIPGQVSELLKLSRSYDVIYDQLNRCSIFLGFLKKLGLMKCKLITVMHHPPYTLQFNVSDSDAYVFFNEDYRELAMQECRRKSGRMHVNEWYPDVKWYHEVLKDHPAPAEKIPYIDNGKSRRDRAAMIYAADKAQVRVDYAGNENGSEGFARAYCVDLNDDIGMVKRLAGYKAILIPIQERDIMIGPSGITSFLDCLALGIPVIASDNACFAKDVQKYNLGIIYKTGDGDALADAMKKLEQDEQLYARMQENITAYAKERTIEAYSKKLVEIVKTVCGKD